MNILVRGLENMDEAAALAALFMQEGSSQGQADYLLDCAKHADGFLLASVAGKLVGYAAWLATASYPPLVSEHIPELHGMAVLPSVRRKGVARALLATIEGDVVKAGYKSLCLGVGVTQDYQAALSLYLDAGYRPDGRGLYHGDGKKLTYGDNLMIDASTSLWFVKSL